MTRESSAPQSCSWTQGHGTSPPGDDLSDTPKLRIAEEADFQAGEHDHFRANIFEAVYQIYVALEAGKPYAGIDSFTHAVGKRFLRIMADGSDGGPVFTRVDVPASGHGNCYRRNLYLLFDDAYLLCTAQPSLWIDNAPVDGPLVDVSSRFPDLIGATIKEITFDHNDAVRDGSHYGQPIVPLRMDNGTDIHFTTNFGEAEKTETCAYCYYGELRRI